MLDDRTTADEGVDHIIWINVGNVDSMIGSLQGGEIDTTGTMLSNSQTDRTTNAAGVEKMISGDFALLGTKLIFPCSFICDKEFRVALAKLIDTEGFATDVLQDRMAVSSGESPIPDLMPWHTPDTARYGLNIDKAKSFLEQVGYTQDDDGNLRFPSGDAWVAFVERTQLGNMHKRHDELGQADFSRGNTYIEYYSLVALGDPTVSELQRLLAKRLAISIVLALVVVLIIFAVLRLLPGSPSELLVIAGSSSQQQITEIRAMYSLD